MADCTPEPEPEPALPAPVAKTGTASDDNSALMLADIEGLSQVREKPHTFERPHTFCN